jgi:ATP-dependent RNA helicase DeaD
MLSMGFKKELTKILNHAENYNTWLFSATMPEGIKQIIKKYLSEDANFLKVSKRSVVNKNIYHKYLICDKPERFNILLRFLKEQGDNRGVVFCKTKKDAQVLAKKLIAKNIETDAIHGDLIQKDRDKVMRAFKNKKLQVLVATDLAARGIDVENLAYVVHYQIPDQLDYYTHRSGRTARAGKKGISLCLVSSSELKQIKYFENKLNIAFEQIREI